jgi:Regulator of polyketide synthase expression
LADVERVANGVSERVLARHPALIAVDESAVLRSTSANVGAFLSTLAFGVPAESVDPPDGALDLVDQVACRPDGLPVLLRAYTLGAAETWQVLAAQLGANAPDVGTLTRLMLISSAHLDRYADHVAQRLTERWSDVSTEMARTGRRRESALRALLRGENTDPEALGHPLDGYHVALAARSPNPSRLHQTLADIRGRLTGAATIELEEPDGVHLLWYSARTPPPAALLERLTSAVPDGVHLAVSDVGSGAPGFVAVSREARDTLRALIRLRPAGGTARYRQLALAATLFADPQRAHRLARVVLGPLAEPSPEAERLRTTLAVYFACQESKAAASTQLRIHEKTVAYRLRRAAELLGTPVEHRRAELEAALLVFDSGDD